ncbi:ATP-binding protein [Streptomyces sp. NPDC090106]|uniref:ATP-binding protein n=1 Tax=Streptomyces sp. NPDC090106 TaxID=3365946 RepID=UPI0037FBFD69
MTPQEESSFVGRSQEIDLVGASLEGARLTTLTGVGGVGKTRLARRVVSLDRVDAADGVAWADLSPLRNADLLAATVADALDLSDHTPRLPTDVIRGWVGDRQILLVLDSCEHLTAECRALVDELLAGCPGLRVLATSREPLRASGETVLGIEPLASGDEAVTLFADRAAAAGNPLKDDADRQLAATLCDHLERLPLALELAAARLRTMPLTDLCVGPRSLVDLPAQQPHRTPRRHDALRTTIGWSHELCTPQERLLWARLSYLPGEFDAGTAVQVAGSGPLAPGAVRPALASLRDKSVITERDGAYRMLDSVREYGRMWLAELGEERAVADRHVAHLLGVTRQAHHEWFGPAQSAWYRRIAALHPDLRTALDHLLVTDPVTALEMAGQVTFYWVCSGYLYEARQYLERAMRLLSGVRGGRILTQGLWSLGIALTLQGEHAAARSVAADGRRTAEALGSEARGRAAYLDGLLHLLEGRPLAAEAVVVPALVGVALATPSAARAAAPHPGPPSAAGALCRLVQVFALTGSGRLEQARAKALELRDACVAADEYWTRSYLDHQLALIAVMERRERDAVRHSRAAVLSKQRIGDAFGIAMAMDVLAISLADADDPRAAACAFGGAQRYWETVGHPQRGTPEMEPLRDQCQDLILDRLGATEYERLLARAATSEPAALLAWASEGGPLPPG